MAEAYDTAPFSNARAIALFEACSGHAFPAADLRTRIAETDDEKRAAFALVARMYSSKGFEKPEALQAESGMHTVIVESGRDIVGTLSLNRGSFGRLLAEDIFQAEIDQVRQHAGLTCELTKFAVVPNGTSKAVIESLFRRAQSLANEIGCHTVVMEVHPRHARLYRRFGFEPYGDVKVNRRVNAPACLLAAPVRTVEQKLRFRAGLGGITLAA